MSYAFFGLAIATGVAVPVTRLLMWRAWLKFNLKVIESQSGQVDTSAIAASFLDPVFIRTSRGRDRLTNDVRTRLDREAGD